MRSKVLFHHVIYEWTEVPKYWRQGRGSKTTFFYFVNRKNFWFLEAFFTATFIKFQWFSRIKDANLSFDSN